MHCKQLLVFLTTLCKIFKMQLVCIPSFLLVSHLNTIEEEEQADWETIFPCLCPNSNTRKRIYYLDNLKSLRSSSKQFQY